MASDLSADAPAFNPASACGSSGRGDHDDDDGATSQAAAAAAGIAVDQIKPASQSQPPDSTGSANLDGSENLGKADAGEADQLQPASQPKPLAATGGAGLYGQGFPAYMVNCYPFVRQPQPSATGNDLIADATLVSPRSVDGGGSLDYHFHSNAKGAASPEWLLAHSSVSVGGYPYVASAAPAGFVGAHHAAAAVSPPMMQLYGGGTAAWPAMQAPAGGGGSNGFYHVYPPLAVAGHTELPSFRAASERGRLSRPGAHRGGRAGGARRGARWSGTEIGGGSRAWGGTSDESYSVAAATPSSSRSYQRGGRWRRGDEAAPDDGSTGGRSDWIQERVSPAQAKWGTTSVGTQNESNSPVAGRWLRPRTQIVKDACSQTDLADSIAHLTLVERPSSFYVGNVTGAAAAVRGRGRQSGASSSGSSLLNHGVGRITSVEAGIGTSPAACSRRGGRTVRSSAAADVVDNDQSPLRRTDGAVSNHRARPHPSAADASGSVESPAAHAEASPRTGCDRAASLHDDGSSSFRPALAAAVHRLGAAEQRTAAACGGSGRQAPSGENGGSPDSASDVITEATRKRRCRRGPRKSKAAAATAVSTAAAAAVVIADQRDVVAVGDGEAEEETDEYPNPRTGQASQRRLLADVVKSQPLAARHAAAPDLVSGSGRASGSEESRPAASTVPASSGAVMSRGLLTVDRGGDSGKAALANGAHSYSQALLKTAQPSAAARRPPAVPQSAWAANEAQLGCQSDRGASDVEKSGDGGFMFNSVSYASRVSVSGTVPQRRPSSGGTRGTAVGVSSGGDRSHALATVAAAAAAGELIDPHSDLTASGSRRQKKAESARLAAAEEQMEISLEQRVLLGQIGRLAAAAPLPAAAAAPPAIDASKKQLHATPSSSSAAPSASSGKKSRQSLSLNLSDMIAAAAASAANKKKEAASRDEVQSRKLGDVTKRAGAKSFAAATAPNALDSTAPTIKRGKEREKPKVKRPSALKKVILKERQDRKESRATGAAGAAVVALGVSSDGQLSGGAGNGDLLSSSCGGSDDIRLLGRGTGGTAPTSSSGCSGQHDDNLIVNLEVAERQQPLDASFEGSTMALSTPGGTSGRLSSRSGDAFTPASQASMPLSPISQTSPISVEALSLESSPFASEAGTPVRPIEVVKELQLQQEIAHKIHSRRFREYCDQLLDADIDDACTLLLHELVRFQERLFARDPVKAKTRRRLVLGLREVTKHLRLRKIKLVIVSPNVERIQSKGGLDDALSTVVSLCREQAVPLVFALGRRALGRACGKLVPVSVAGVFMYDGAEIHYRRLMELTQKARDGYEDMIKLVAQEAADERQKLAAAASGRSSPPVSKQPVAGGSASSQTVSQHWPQASMQPSLSTAAQPIDVARIAASASKEGVSSSSMTADHPEAAAVRDRQLVASTNDNDDCADEEAIRRRNFEYDGDAGNEADVEDSLQDSVAVPGYYRLLNGDGGSEAEAVPVLPVATRPPLSRKASSREPAVAKPPPPSADVESDGSTALAASATVTCSSTSSRCSASSGNASSSSDASTTGPGRRNSSKKNSKLSRRMKGSRTADGVGVARCGEPSAAAAVQPLPLDIRERVESWVAAHTNAAAAASSTISEAAVATAADLLDVDDVAEFTATLSACTANSDALLLGAVGSGGP